MMAGVMAVLSETEKQDLDAESRHNLQGAIRFLTERLAALRSIADPKAPRVNVAAALPRGRGPSRTIMFDVARGLARRVPLTKLIHMDSDVRPFLASLLVSAVHKAKQPLFIPEGLKLREMAQKEFDNMIAEMAGETYDNYGVIGEQLMKADPGAESVEQAQQRRMQGQLDRMQHLLEQLTGSETVDVPM